MSTLVKGLVSAAILSLSMSAFAADAVATTSTTSSVDTACSSEMTTSGCQSGHEMGKCFHEYKKKHHEFKVSEGCKKAMKDAHEMKKEEMKKDEKKS